MVWEVIIHNTKTDKIYIGGIFQHQKKQDRLLNYGTRNIKLQRNGLIPLE